MHTLRLDLGERSYNIVIGCGVMQKLATHLAPLVPLKRVIIVTEKSVAKHHLKNLVKEIDAIGISQHTITLEPGEATKSFSVFESLVNDILSHKPERGDVLIALGGGVIGDLTGFAASVVLRGLSFIQIPTTLLSMVDSSVGGKTGINTSHGKNLVGAFYQPKAVLIDINHLNTLPKRDLLAGYAEVVKMAALGDIDFMHYLETHAEEAFDQATINHDFFSHIINHSCAMKASIVKRDEREGNIRALLNLGHTFGHALEKAAGYDGTLLHGEAVSIGMCMAGDFSAHLGLCKHSDSSRIASHLEKVGLPVSMKQRKVKITATQMLDSMMQDKKVQNKQLHMILLNSIGHAFVARDVERDALESYLKKVCKA